MATFFERNKRKSVLALLLLLIRWRKGVIPLLAISLLLMLVSWAPGNLMGIFLVGLSKLPLGARSAAAITWSSSKVGLEFSGVAHHDSYREYYLAFEAASHQGLSAMLERRSFSDLMAAFKAARDDKGAGWGQFFRGGKNGAGSGGNSLDMIKGNPNDIDSAAGMGMAAKIKNGESVNGVLNPDEAKDTAKGVALGDGDLTGERAGMVESAFATTGPMKLSPADMMGNGSQAYASSAFFSSGNPGQSGAAGTASLDTKGVKGGKQMGYGRGAAGNSKSANLKQSTRRGGRTVNLGRHGVKASKALAQLRGMATLNSQIHTSGPAGLETSHAAAQEQFEGSSLAGSGAQPGAVPDPSGGGGGKSGAVPSGGGFAGPTGGGAAPSAGEVPTYHPGDPGIVCTAKQISEGMMSNGKECVEMPTAAAANATPWQNKTDDAIKLILEALGLMIAGALLMAIGQPFMDFCCTIPIGLGFIGSGIALEVKAGQLLGKAMSIGSDVAHSQGGGFQGALIYITAITAIFAALFITMSAFVPGAPVPTAVGALAVVFLVSFLLLELTTLLAPKAPKIPEVDNPIQDKKDKIAANNANTGGEGTGLAEAPEGMHYEKDENGVDVLTYNSPVDKSVMSPSLKEELNKQKGGAGTGLDPAPKGQHYEADPEHPGQSKLFGDYPLGVAERTDANSFKGGEGTKFPPAPDGKHYELMNTAGDVKDPKNWKLVDDYKISDADKKAANANKGGPSDVLCKTPAPAGQHYEGLNACTLVDDYK